MRRYHARKHYILLVAAAYSFAISISAQDFGGTVSAAMDAFREVRAQNAAPDYIKAIFAKASAAEDNGCINFCGFYLGMSETDANTLATFYGLNNNEWSFFSTSQTKQVFKMTFTLHGIRRITKGGNTFEELSQAVANRIGTMQSKHDDDWNLSGYEYKNIDDQTAQISERNGLMIEDRSLKRKAEFERAEAERKAAAARAEAERKAAAARAEAERKAAAARAEAERIAAAARAEAERKALEDLAKLSLDRLSKDMVSIPEKDFAICKYEVTQILWFAVMGGRPVSSNDTDIPIFNVSLDDCLRFIAKLNDRPEIKASDYIYRLPTADEWEYACLAGANGRYCKLADGEEITKYNLGIAAWYVFNSEGKVHPVCQKKPNAFGLYDMLGNVCEWTSTIDNDSYVTCGASWRLPSGYLWAGCRNMYNKEAIFDDLGFRLACDVVK